MDRMEFLRLIGYENCETNAADIICEFFDQYMLLYDLVDTVTNVSIMASSKVADNRYITFKLEYNDISSSSALAHKLSNITSAVIYGTTYNVFTSVTDNVVIVTISR